MTGHGGPVVRTGQRLLAVSLAGAAALSYPLLAVADVDRSLFGIPVLYCYLFVVWASLIGALAALTARRG